MYECLCTDIAASHATTQVDEKNTVLKIFDCMKELIDKQSTNIPKFDDVSNDKTKDKQSTNVPKFHKVSLCSKIPYIPQLHAYLCIFR